jgi:hypothetical protein
MVMKTTWRWAAGLAAAVTAAAGLLAGPGLAADAGVFPAFVGPLHTVSTLASTVPANGDVNPYGVAVVPRSTGDLSQGNVLNGTVAPGSPVVNRGTVLRLSLPIPDFGVPRLVDSDTIGSGFSEQLNDAALVVGPTGVGLRPDGVLYVADTLNNRVAGIPGALFRDSSAGTGFTVSRNGALNGELGLAIAPGGDILTVNGGDGNLVEITPFGRQVAVRVLDSSGSPPGAGALFGLASCRARGRCTSWTTPPTR